MGGKWDNTTKLDALLASVTDDMLGGEVMEQFQDFGLRVECILLELVRPDPVQPRPSNQEDSDQFNELNQPAAFGEDKPTHSAENAQSITDPNSQTKQHKNHQTIQHNSYSAVVVDIEKEKKEDILQALGKLGISYLKAKELIEKYGRKRITEVAEHAQDQKCTNPAGYVIRALKENWIFWSKPEKDDYACGDGRAYITGKYTAFINH